MARAAIATPPQHTDAETLTLSVNIIAFLNMLIAERILTTGLDRNTKGCSQLC